MIQEYSIKIPKSKPRIRSRNQNIRISNKKILKMQPTIFIASLMVLAQLRDLLNLPIVELLMSNLVRRHGLRPCSRQPTS